MAAVQTVEGKEPLRVVNLMEEELKKALPRAEEGKIRPIGELIRVMP